MSGAIAVSIFALAEIGISLTIAKENKAMNTLTHASLRSDRLVLARLMSWATLVDWWKRKRTLVAIQHLDNHLRRDIGLDPIPPLGGIEAALRVIAMTALR